MLLTLNSRTFHDPHDIFSRLFLYSTTYKFTEKQQLLITEHFNKHSISGA